MFMPISSEFINPQKSLAQYVYNKMPITFFPRGPAQLAGPTGIFYSKIIDFFVFLLRILIEILKKLIFKFFQNLHFLSFFSPPRDDLNPNFYLAYNLQTSKSFRLAYFSKRAIPGNTIKSKFERMSLLQILISNPQLYRYVADLVFQNFPDTVLLFELG